MQNARKNMGQGFGHRSLLLHLLIIMFASGSIAMNLEHDEKHTTLNLYTGSDNNNQEAAHAKASARMPSHMDHMDPSRMVFFSTRDLKVGRRMPVYFPKTNLATSPHFIPREQAEAIPFSLEELPYLLEFFSLSPASPQAKSMEETLRGCNEVPPIRGETKFCATSLESMLDFARSMLGSDCSYKVVTTSYLTKSITTTFQNYTILEATEEIPVLKMVACHSLPYPYAVFHCHILDKSKLYEVLLGGDDGDRVKAAALCHSDTSQWGANHVAFQVLGIKPGTVPVCHFFPADDLILVSAPAKA